MTRVVCVCVAEALTRDAAQSLTVEISIWTGWIRSQADAFEPPQADLLPTPILAKYVLLILLVGASGVLCSGVCTRELPPGSQPDVTNTSTNAPVPPLTHTPVPGRHVVQEGVGSLILDSVHQEELDDIT